MAGPYVLSEDDLSTLRQMLEAWRGKDSNQNRRPRYPTHVNPTSDTYLALTPSGGIAALSGTVPGSAVCPIYQIANGQLQAAAAPPQTVFNFSATAVAGSTYIQTDRDRWGNWLATSTGAGTGGGGGGDVVQKEWFYWQNRIGAGSFQTFKGGPPTGSQVLRSWYGAGILSLNSGQVGICTPTPQVLYVLPLFSVRGGTIDKMMFFCHGGSGPAAFARMGLYSVTSDANIYPGSLFFDAGVQPVATEQPFAGFIKYVFPPVTIAPNSMYWVALLMNDPGGPFTSIIGCSPQCFYPILGTLTEIISAENLAGQTGLFFSTLGTCCVGLQTATGDASFDPQNPLPGSFPATSYALLMDSLNPPLLLYHLAS